MEQQSVLEDVAQQLQDSGYYNLTYKPSGRGPSISGIITDVDFSNAKKSVPDGENTGPFKTLDNADELIPDDIRYICDEYGLEVQVLGNGPERLHLHISHVSGPI